MGRQAACRVEAGAGVTSGLRQTQPEGEVVFSVRGDDAVQQQPPSPFPRGATAYPAARTFTCTRSVAPSPGTTASPWRLDHSGDRAQRRSVEHPDSEVVKRCLTPSHHFGGLRTRSSDSAIVAGSVSSPSPRKSSHKDAASRRINSRE